MKPQLETPVALIFFTRPETLEKVFAQVRKARPKKLFLIQDGPRDGNKSDISKIAQCREIVENVDWDCEIYKNYAEKNLGCGQRPASGITWVFEHVEKAIILEDDCIPCDSFFDYCEELLNRYENDERIAYISGLNHFEQWDCGDYSYCFTKTGAIWGWATWKRAWQRYDYYVDAINDKYAKKNLYNQIKCKLAAKERIKNWEMVNSLKNTGSKLTFWDMQWGMVKYLNNQLVIVPKYNQIINVGIGADSTHARTVNTKKAKKFQNFFFINTRDLQFPLKHPDFCCCDDEYDASVYKITYGNEFIYAIKKFAKRLLKR